MVIFKGDSHQEILDFESQIKNQGLANQAISCELSGRKLDQGSDDPKKGVRKVVKKFFAK